MNGLADVDGYKICIQVCMWFGFLTPEYVGCETSDSIVLFTSNFGVLMYTILLQGHSLLTGP